MQYEERLIRDSNGFWQAQCRFLPLEPWEPNEGWRTFFISSVKESAEKRMKGVSK